MSASRPVRTLRDPAALARAGLIAPERAAALEEVAARYAVAVSATSAALIDPTDAADPIARQFIPDPRELQARPQELADPIGDGVHSPTRGVVHRYPDRALFAPTLVCPVYCRFCFRREVVGPGAQAALSRGEIAAALDYFRAHSDIREVILTGGDPLGLTPARIGALVGALAEIPHVATIRAHSRVPVATSERVTDDFVAALAGPIRARGKTVAVAAHANHPREFTPAARAALRRLADAGIMLLSQSVLLAGVNDDADTLAALMRAFVAAGAKPYYLHHPDLAPGTGHFRLPIARGLALVRGLRGRVSGLAQPTYVLDIPGGHGKVALDSAAARPLDEGLWELTDFRGRAHLYREA
ncbi:MAG: lysine-2,3-aminomutase-like protein [Rhizobiales bacterium]|nr:lysine-2,3-aminomutase-like protein [Hyphomicrobiales bacterium]